MRPALGSRRISCAGALLFSAACSNGPQTAAPEPGPASLAAGLYEVSVTQKGLGFSKAEKPSKPICVRQSEINAFPYRLAEEYFVADGGCRNDRAPREGDAFSGEIACAADRKVAPGKTRFVYKGVLAPGLITLEGNMRLDFELPKGAGGAEVNDKALKVAKTQMEKIRTVIEARRISDCR
ncbi:MAG: hypothetical protein K2Q06_08025 [Parvularculaceae bacterium]|nr:hypothetical protein [Parvularculaceae bacterium]